MRGERSTGGTRNNNVFRELLRESINKRGLMRRARNFERGESMRHVIAHCFTSFAVRISPYAHTHRIAERTFISAPLSMQERYYTPRCKTADVLARRA